MSTLPTLIAIDASLRDAVTSGEVAGVVVGQVRDGGASFVAHGHVRRDADAPMAPDSIVRIHSMSKPITTAALLTLVDEGSVALDTPVAAFVPAFARTTRVVTDESGAIVDVVANDAPLTLRHLLTHTAGLVYASPDGTPMERLAWDALGTVDEPLEAWSRRLASVPLAYAPGEGFGYGVATDLVGHVIEVVTGRTLERALRERVFEPLGMDDTGFEVPAHARARVATIHRRSASGLEPVAWDGAYAFETPTFLSGGGGLFSTCADYLRFAAMLAAGGSSGGRRFLREETVVDMRRPHVVGPSTSDRRVPGLGCAFGLGVRVVTDDAGNEFGPKHAFGWDGLAGTTFVVDASGRGATVCMTQILPWPTRIHALVRSPCILPPWHIERSRSATSTETSST